MPDSPILPAESAFLHGLASVMRKERKVARGMSAVDKFGVFVTVFLAVALVVRHWPTIAYGTPSVASHESRMEAQR